MAYSVVEYKQGDRIFERGDTGAYMYLVQGGEVEVLQEVGDHEVQIAVLKRTDFFGEMAILEGESRTHAVRALTDVKLVRIDASGFKNLLLRNPDVSMRMVRKLSGRVAHTEDMLMRAHAGSSAARAKTAKAGRVSRLVGVNQTADLPLPVEKDEIHIGRQDPMHGILPDIDLTAVDSQISTSRRHAMIERRGGAFFLQEVSATNGTFVNAQRIPAGRPIEIRNGDEILFGGVRMRFVVE